MADHGLGLLLVRGALRSPFKRPSPEAGFPRTPLVRTGVRADQDRLAAYERVCGFATDGGDLPLTYPHVLGFPSAMRLMTDRAFPLPLLGLVHTSVEITRHAPLPAAGEYELAVRIEKLAPHRRGTEATVVTGMRAAGQTVWESRSTYLARHRTGTATGSRTAPDPAHEGTAALPVVAEWRLAGDIGRRYGAVSGDRNPIHLHPVAARLFGFPRAIAHGMWTAARCLAADASDGTRVRIRFLSPVLLPGTVTYGADGSGRFELRGADGRLHLCGEVS